MKKGSKGFAFRLVGLILGIVGICVSSTAVVFAAIGLHQARRCTRCKIETGV